MHPHRNYLASRWAGVPCTKPHPAVIAPYGRDPPADWLLLAVLRPAWAYRLELHPAQPPGGGLRVAGRISSAARTPTG
jgi:hypothetical protein